MFGVAVFLFFFPSTVFFWSRIWSSSVLEKFLQILWFLLFFLDLWAIGYWASWAVIIFLTFFPPIFPFLFVWFSEKFLQLYILNLLLNYLGMLSYFLRALCFLKVPVFSILLLIHSCNIFLKVFSSQHFLDIAESVSSKCFSFPTVFSLSY